MATAAITHIRGGTWSRARLHSAVERLNRSLRTAGLQEEDVVAVIAPNCPEFIAVYLAAVQAGLYLVPINWKLGFAELRYVLEDSEARGVFVHERVGSILDCPPHAFHARLELKVIIGSSRAPGFQAWDDFIQGGYSAPLEARATGRIMGYTSATTGRAKGVYRKLNPLSSPNVSTSSTRTVAHEDIEFPRNGVHLVCSALYHAPVLHFAGKDLDDGSSVIVCDKWDPEETLSLIEQHQVTTMFVVPAMFIRFLKLPLAVRARYDCSSLRMVLHAGAPCPVVVKKQMIDWWGEIIWERYGSVELGPVTRIGSKEWLRQPGSVGRPDSGVSIRVIDSDGSEVEPGTIGAIYVRPLPEYAFEYKGDATKTLAARRGEYFTVGDVGYINSDGYLFLCDRESNVIVTAGVNIYPAQIEEVLIQHPNVLDCAVFGTPHDLVGEVAKALIVPSDLSMADSQLRLDVLRFLRARLSAHQVPAKVELVESLPREPNGKLYKRMLLDTLSN